MNMRPPHILKTSVTDASKTNYSSVCHAKKEKKKSGDGKRARTRREKKERELTDEANTRSLDLGTHRSGLIESSSNRRTKNLVLCKLNDTVDWVQLNFTPGTVLEVLYQKRKKKSEVIIWKFPRELKPIAFCHPTQTVFCRVVGSDPQKENRKEGKAEKKKGE